MKKHLNEYQNLIFTKKPANAGFFVYLIIQSSDRKIIIVIYIGKGKIRSRFLKYILINDAVSIHQF